MAIGNLKDYGRPFRPTNKGGGSEKGKPQKSWPMIVKVVAEALVTRAKGSQEAFCVDRSAPFSMGAFAGLMERMLPGIWKAAPNFQGQRKTSYERLLYNRTYKMYYSGTSDRGRNHNPKTRACESGEHWRKKVPPDSPLFKIHDGIVRGTIVRIPNWEKYITR